MSTSFANRNPVGLRELEGRRQLADVGCLWLPAWYNTNVTPGDAKPRLTIPRFNAHVLFSEHVFALDVDDNPGLMPYRNLLDRADTTLSWQSLRGPKAAFQLPPGAPRLQHGAHPYAGLEILTRQALAPGSTKKGHYYPVLTLKPIATIPMELALELAELAPVKPTPRTSRTYFTVEAVPFSHEWRKQQHVRRPSQQHPGHLRVSADALRRRTQWHNETRQGERLPAIKRIALQMIRYGETYAEFKAEILSHPVRKGLEGRGDTNVVLAGVWDWAEREVAATSVVRRELAGERAAAEHRPLRVALVWMTHAQAVIDAKYAHLPQRHTKLSDIIRTQASWLQRFGFDYYLPYRVLLAYLDITSHSSLTKYIEMLEELTLLARRHDKRSRQVDGMRWTLVINNEDVATTQTPTPLIDSSSFPPADQALLSDEDIDWLLDYAGRRDAQAEERRRQNARSKRIEEVRTRVAAAENDRQNAR